MRMLLLMVMLFIIISIMVTAILVVSLRIGLIFMKIYHDWSYCYYCLYVHITEASIALVA